MHFHLITQRASNAPFKTGTIEAPDMEAASAIIRKRGFFYWGLREASDSGARTRMGALAPKGAAPLYHESIPRHYVAVPDVETGRVMSTWRTETNPEHIASREKRAKSRLTRKSHRAGRCMVANTPDTLAALDVLRLLESAIVS